MPCACRAPLESYPENAEWGPLFWKLLHGLAEYSGKQQFAILQGDEVRAWISLLISLKDTLPCDICEEHQKVWLAEHPPSIFLQLPQNEFRGAVRSWLFELHNEINEGNDKPVFSFQDLEITYKSVNIREGWKALEPVIKRAITLNGLTLLPWKKFLGYVRILQGIYGV